MNKSKKCSICIEELSYKRELQNFNCKNCNQSDDRLICNNCIVNIDKCPFCRGSKCEEVRIDIHRTTLGAVNNLIIVKKKKCCDKLVEKLCKSNLEEDESEISFCNFIRMLNIKNTLITIWMFCVLFFFGYYGCNKNNHDCSICVVAGIISPICIISYVIKLLSDIKFNINLIFSCFWSFLFTILILLIFGIDVYCNFNIKILYIGIILFIIFFCCSMNTSINCCF